MWVGIAAELAASTLPPVMSLCAPWNLLSPSPAAGTVTAARQRRNRGIANWGALYSVAPLLRDDPAFLDAYVEAAALV
jgi:hypothetical protein